MSVHIDEKNNVHIILKGGYCCAECDRDAKEEDRKECFPLCRKCYDEDGQ